MIDYLSTPEFAATRRSFQDADVGATVVEGQSYILRWANDAFCRMVGRRLDEIAGQDIRALGDLGPDAHAEVEAVHAGRQTAALIHRRFVRPDGAQVWLRITVMPLPGGLALGVSQEVPSERASVELLHRLVAHAPVAIVSVDQSGRVAVANPEAERLLRFAPGALVGRQVEELVPPEARDAHRAHRRRYNKAPDVRRIGHGRDLRALCGDGSEIVVEASLNPIGDGGVQLVLVDVTERKRAERELARRAERQAAVARFGERALEGAGVRQLQQLACELVAEHVAADAAGVLEADGAADGMVVRAIHGLPVEMLGERMPIGDSAFGPALKASEPVVIPDVRSGLPADSRLQALGARSVAAVLVGTRNEPMGVLGVFTREARDFAPDDLAFLRSVANVLADAIRRHRAEAAIRHQALHDALTGLPNRTLLMERIRHWIDGAHRSELQAAVVLIDIDHFQVVNDALGHRVGDDLLRAMGPRLRRAVRPADTVARLGAATFVVFCRDITGEAEALAIAGRVTQMLREPFRLIGGHTQPLTASIGVALTCRPAMDADEVLRNADIAMYRAKVEGRDRTVLFSTALHDSALARHNTERELRAALEQGQIDVHFQPIVRIEDQSVIGLEALARWTHPERGPVSPAEFVPLAEATGLIGRLGEHVLRVSAAQVAAWSAAGHDLFVSVNLSAREVSDPATLDLVRDVLAEHGIAGSRLAFEMTETAVLGDITAARTVMDGLRAMGARVKLDDFGTGYSSLAHIRSLPFDCLKVDRSFVAAIADDDESRGLLGAIVQMGRVVRADIIAEGVETSEQQEILRALGCGIAQGWLHGRPMPAADVPRFLQERHAAPA